MPKKVNKQNNNDLDDTKWKKYTSDKIKDSKLLYYSGDIPETIYSITKEYIDKAKKIDKIISDVEEKESNTIYKIYKIYDNENVIISYTKNIIENVVINDLFNNYKNNKDYNRINVFKNIENIKYKLLYICKANKEDNILKEMKEIKTKFENENNVNTTAKEDRKIYEEYFNLVNDNFKTTKSQKYYIQKIYDSTIDSEIYIFGSYQKLKQTDIKKYKTDNNIDFKNNKLKVEIISEIDINNDIAGLIKTDEYIKFYNTIDKGLNKTYNIIDTFDNTQELFMLIQETKIINKQVDFKDCYNKACIASIVIDKYKYLFIADNISFNIKLREFYKMKRHCSKTYEKLINLLKVTPVEDIKINILQEVTNKEELNIYLYDNMNKYNKEELLNYHDFDNEYITKDEFKNERTKMAGYIFSYKKK